MVTVEGIWLTETYRESMKSIKKFLTEDAAMRFVDKYPLQNFLISKELDGMFYIYNME